MCLSLYTIAVAKLFGEKNVEGITLHGKIYHSPYQNNISNISVNFCLARINRKHQLNGQKRKKVEGICKPGDGSVDKEKSWMNTYTSTYKNADLLGKAALSELGNLHPFLDKHFLDKHFLWKSLSKNSDNVLRGCSV